MFCKKKTPKLEIEIFQYFTYNGCESIQSDETFVIDINDIYCANGCGAIDNDDNIIHINLKLKLLLFDFCQYQDENIYLCTDNRNYNGNLL